MQCLSELYDLIRNAHYMVSDGDCFYLAAVLLVRTNHIERSIERILVLLLLTVLLWLWIDQSYFQSSRDGSLLGGHRAVPSSYTPVDVAQIRLSDLLYPIPSSLGDPPWIKHNHKQLRAFMRCVESGSCGKNQMKVVILSSNQFRSALYGGNGGEQIWCVHVCPGLCLY